MAQTQKSSLSFKIWTLSYISFITIYRFVKAFLFPNVTVVPDQFLLGTVLFSLAYIWAQEVKDRHLLQEALGELTRAHEDLKRGNINTISALILSVEAKDPYTFGHSERVMKYSFEFGKRIGYSKRELEILKNACLLHDVGKISIPDSILHKSTELTKEEWGIIRNHPRTGSEILLPLEFLKKERLIILHHHERFDGSGYPDGLREDGIPLSSRIIALADSYDAMKSKRPYRDQAKDETVIGEIIKNSGTQFDPELTQLFLAVIKEGPII